MIASLGDYLTANGGVVNLKQVDVIMSEVGDIEDEVFKRRKAADVKDQVCEGRGCSCGWWWCWVGGTVYTCHAWP